jgi:hypothetical protein
MNRSGETSWKYGMRFSLMNDDKEYALFGNESECVAKVDVEVRIVLGMPGVS